MDGKQHSTPSDAPPGSDMHKHHSGSGPAPPPPPQGGQQYSQAPPQAQMGAPGQDDGQQCSAPGGPPPGGYYQQQAPQAYQGGPPQHGHYQGGPPPPGYQGGPPPQGYQQGGPPPQFVGGAQPRGNRLFNDEEAGCDIACVVVGACFFPFSLWCVAALDQAWPAVNCACVLLESCTSATVDATSAHAPLWSKLNRTICAQLRHTLLHPAFQLAAEVAEVATRVAGAGANNKNGQEYKMQLHHVRLRLCVSENACYRSWRWRAASVAGSRVHPSSGGGCVAIIAAGDGQKRLHVCKPFVLRRVSTRSDWSQTFAKRQGQAAR